LQDALKTAGTKPAAGGTTAQPQNPSSTTASGKGAANVANLNVRSQANTTSTSLAKLAKGESVTILSKSGDWYKIMTSKSKTGWVLGKLITIKK
jgi:N-acetylmuramoyl-L-alanine amidase